MVVSALGGGLSSHSSSTSWSTRVTELACSTSRESTWRSFGADGVIRVEPRRRVSGPSRPTRMTSSSGWSTASGSGAWSANRAADASAPWRFGMDPPIGLRAPLNHNLRGCIVALLRLDDLRIAALFEAAATCVLAGRPGSSSALAPLERYSSAGPQPFNIRPNSAGGGNVAGAPVGRNLRDVIGPHI